jgi:hypothetical protein
MELACFLNYQTNLLYSRDSKTRNFTLLEHVYIILSYSIFIERFRLKQKKKVSSNLKNMPIEYRSNFTYK